MSLEKFIVINFISLSSLKGGAEIKTADTINL